MAITINPISPVAFSVFGIDIRWYAMAYIAGFVLGYLLIKKMLASPKSPVAMNKKQLDDLKKTQTTTPENPASDRRVTVQSFG
jgi:prolipoprotein diacylglyceryltransferase